VDWSLSIETSPAPSPLPAVPDKTPPRGKAKFKHSYKLGRVLRGGIVGSATYNEPGIVSGTATVAARTAKGLHLARAKAVAVAKGRANIAAANKATKLVLKLSRKAKSKLRAAHRKVGVSLKLVLRDASGNKRTLSVKTTLRP
jgi:hypothetical protein